MSAKTRRSVLQTEILARLKVGSVRSITALASAIGTSRPSVSRSLHALQEQGLVRQDGRTWSLSKAGEGQVGISVAKLQEAAEESVSLTGRRFKVLNRMGMASMAMASLDDMIASQTRKIITDAAHYDMASLGTSPIESTAVPTSIAIQEQAVGNHASTADLAGMSAAQGIEDRVNNAFKPDLSSISGVRELAAELGMVATGVAEAYPSALQDVGTRATDSVWDSITRAERVYRSVLMDLSADVSNTTSRIGEEALLAKHGSASGTMTTMLEALGNEATTADSVAGKLASGADAMACVAATLNPQQSATELMALGGADGPSTALAVLEDLSGMAGFKTSVATFAEGVARGTASLVTAQEDYASFLSGIRGDDASLAYSVIGHQARLLAEAMDHIHALQGVEMVSALQSIDLHDDLSALPGRLTSVTASLADYIHDQTVRAHHLNYQTPTLIADQMVLSTAPVTHYMGAVRSFVVAESQSDAPQQRQVRRERQGSTRLDAPLAQLHPDLPAMRRGAWLALTGDNPDRLRHAATSQRDLLTQLLRLLVPSLEQVEDDERGSKIKARVKKAVGNSESNTTFVASIADAVYSYYSMMSKFNHTNQKHQDGLRAILVTGEGLIEFILVSFGVHVDEV